ncbi:MULTISPECIES: site-specific integrase [unclassified Paraburkholderia]|uniref:site-specific integrase n=1 Tax=unclassified Paraburkholderia TaxID=2615204 RepID=UPI001619855C|nr:MULTISPECIES: site-specific integrase [unclassified Paraburkholderia]MBB5447878.1 site-specific recombinase XerC [Paraburkholderia sp. WSM4177]MBB5485610.1 site-specific recombinase XerD [Paraburkholderia sp. WSM4180]
MRFIAVLFFRLSYVLRRQKLAFAGNLPERNNPDQANSTFRMGIWMAYISQRGAYWRAEVRKRGHKPIYRTFDTKQQARDWAQRVEAEISLNIFVDRSEAERTTLGEALDRYAREIVPTKRYPSQELTRIARWKKNDLAWRPLAALRGVDFAKYRDARRAAGRAENTIRLELQVISHLFEIARKEWGFETLMNPLKNIRKPTGSRARDRRLLPGEFDALRTRLAASNNPWAAPAFELAVETSLRQGTLFNVRWEWVKIQDRMIEFPPEARGADNKGVPARLPLTRRAADVLRALAALWQRDRFIDPELCQLGPVNVDPDKLSGPVFGTSCNAVQLVWKRIVKSENGFPNLRWHDLRHEAASRLFEKGLHPLEVASVTGHRSMQMLKRYTHLNPADLLTKLG